MNRHAVLPTIRDAEVPLPSPQHTPYLPPLTPAKIRILYQFLNSSSPNECVCCWGGGGVLVIAGSGQPGH